MGTIAAGGLAIWVRPFPFLTFPIAFALWFMSMDLSPLVFGKTEYTWDEHKWVSVMFGLAILLASYLADLGTASAGLCVLGLSRGCSRSGAGSR